jgi:tRNA dimethylallyltransferase
MTARIWLIGGPTASGKSALAVRLAQALDGEIVGADALQIYRGLRVLTARPEVDDEALVPHHLYGVADAAETWSAGRWLQAAQEALAGIAARGRHAVVVGGTGLYFRALTEGLADVPAVPSSVRRQAAEAYDRLGEAGFREDLGERDPAAEARISPGDRQRLLRAWEVHAATGRSLSDFQAETRPALQPGSWRAAALEPPREELYARCDLRLGRMLQAGALEEVRALMARGLDGSLPAMKAVGMRELAAHLAGATSLETALELARRETRRYAKRQSTWLRNQTPDWPRVRALEPQVQWRELVQVLDLGALV